MIALTPSDRRVERLRDLIRWLIPTIFVFALAYAIIGTVFHDRATIISAFLIALYTGGLLVAYIQVQQQRVATAAYMVGGGLVGAVLALTLLQPALYPNYAIVPLLVAAILLQYAPPRHARYYLAVCGAATLVIAALGASLPTTSALPVVLLSVLRVSSIAATAAFTLFMLWQFSSQLTATLDRAQMTNALLEGQNTELAIANETITAQLDEQQRLLGLVSSLEVPVITLTDGLMLIPLLGHIDRRRMEALTSRMLQAVYNARAGSVIFDMSGLLLLDTAIAAELTNAIRSLRLLGCRVFVSGISSTVALTIAHLNITFGDIEMIQTPQEALKRLSGSSEADTTHISAGTTDRRRLRV